MGYLHYIIAILLVIAWAIGYIGYATDGIIHVLLIIAVVAFIIKFFMKEKKYK